MENKSPSLLRIWFSKVAFYFAFFLDDAREFGGFVVLFVTFGIYCVFFSFLFLVLVCWPGEGSFMQVGSVSLGQIAFLSLRAVDGESDLIMVLIQEEMGRVRWWLYLIAFVLRNELNCKYII